MALKPPPPPVKSEPGSFAWMDWYRSLYDLITSPGSIAWTLLDFAGSNITDIAIRLHNSLQTIQGGTAGEYYHLTSAQHVSLTAGASIVTVAVDTTLTLASGTVLVNTTSNAVTITLPNATTSTGQTFIVKRKTAGAFALVVDTDGGNIDDSASISMPTQYEAYAMQSDGTNYWII